MKIGHGRWPGVVIFAIAFGWVESAVVVYLRKIYFNGVFTFPLSIAWKEGKHVIAPLIRVELGREIATIMMLGAVAWVAGRNRLQKLGFFLIAFGVWDLFYYVWLHVMIGWPESPMTWDLLFYIPLPWVGPVITPALIAMTMAVAGTMMIYFDHQGYLIRWRWYDIVMEGACGLLMIAAFCWDWKNILQVPGDIHRTGIPNPFAWWLFLPAYLLAIVYFGIRLRGIVKKIS